MDLIKTLALNDCHNCKETLIGMLNDEKLDEADLLYVLRLHYQGPLCICCIFFSLKLFV